MVMEPVLGLVKHLFSLDRLNLEWFVAAIIVAGTILYLTRIIGISFSYGLGGKQSPRFETFKVDTNDKPFKGPFLAG